jgi:NodT family efflux transporter outer membrane factor (OMF) lipoprotein
LKNFTGLLSPKVPPGIIGEDPSRLRRAPWLLILPVVGALLTQTACRVAPDDTAPEPAGAPVGSATDQTPWQAPVNASVAYPPIVHWWMALNDPELDRLFARAEAQNLDSRVAASRVRQSRACLSAGPNDLHSSPDADRTRARSNDDSTTSGLTKGVGGHAVFWLQGFDATWEIPLFDVQGRPGTVSERAAPADEWNGAMVSLLAEVARDYLELRCLRHQSELAIDNLVIQVDVLELTRSLARQGLATDMDCSRAQNQSELTRAQVAAIQGKIVGIGHAIAILLDQDPGALAAELDSRGAVPAVPSSMGAGLSSSLLRCRPDVRRAERWVEVTNSRIAAALAHDYPMFTLTGSFPSDSARLSAALAGTSRSFPGHPGAIWDLSDFSQTTTLAAHEMGNQRQALLAYQYTLLSALRDVEDALTDLREGQEHDRNQVRAVDGASQALEASRGRYMMGTIDYLEVLGAERQLLLSQDGLAQSRQAVALHLLGLYKALGGGWESPKGADPHRTRPGGRQAPPGIVPIQTSHSCHGDRT